MFINLVDQNLLLHVKSKLDVMFESQPDLLMKDVSDMFFNLVDTFV